MHYQLTNQDFREVLSWGYVRQEIGAHTGLSTVIEAVQPNMGRFELSTMAAGIADIIQLQSDLVNEVRLQSVQGTSHISMHFHLSGYSDAQISGFSQATPFDGQFHNLFYCHEPVADFVFPAQQGYHSFIVMLPPEFVLNKVGVSEEHFCWMAEKIMRRESFAGRYGNLRMQPAMYRVIDEIRQCAYSGSLRKLFLETKVSELFLLQLAQLTSLPRATEYSNGLKPADVEKLYAVREYLDGTYREPHTLQGLCRQFVLNEFKLKKGFKELFGTTVFGYLLDRKLEEAARLLTEDRLSITQISEWIGYRSPAHFIAAFKNKFGTSPGVYRKSV